MRQYYLVVLLFFSIFYSFGQQSKQDSLYSLMDYYSNNNGRFDNVDFKDLVKEICKISGNDRATYYCKISKVKDLFLDKKFSLLIPKAKKILETDAYLKQNIHKAYFLNKTLALSYYQLRKADSVIHYHKENLAIAEITNQKFFDITKLSQIYSIKRDYKNCLKYLKEGLKIIDSIKNNKMEGQFYQSLGETQKHLLFYDNAKINLKTALHYYQKIDSTNIGIGNIYKELGRIAEKENDLNNAILNFNKAISNYKKRKKHTSTAAVLDDLADVYILKKDYDNALKYANQSYNLRIQNNDNRSLRYSYSRLGRLNYLIETPNLDKSVKYLKKALKLNKELNETPVIGAIYLHLFNAYLQKKEIDSAKKYIKQYIHIRDTLSDINSKNLIADLDIKYQTEKKEKELAEQKIATQDQEILTQRANTRNWLLALGLLTLGISVFFIWKRYKTEAKAKQIISEQKNLVETLQKELHHRMKNNLSFIDLFINLAKGRFPDKVYQNKLNELQNRIRSMFEVHKQLFKKEDVTSVRAKNYIDALVENVQQAYSNKNISITNATNINVTLLANTSFPVGLIVNEFVTNSYKYAFDDNTKGVIDIDLTSDDNQYSLSLKDNGKGLPKDFNINDLDSFGLETIQLLTKEYGGTFDINDTNGVTMNITLPKTAV